MKQTIIYTLLFIANGAFGQINNAKVYWVGHSLISHTDTYAAGTDNLIGLLGTLATSQGKTYSHHQHTTPGSPLGWNWGTNTDSWASSQILIEPLIDVSHTDYGTFDVIVLTEAIEINSYYDWWYTAFYARKFYNAAKAANSNTRLFLYESWQHYQATDSDFRSYYGPMATFNWSEYMTSVRPIWENIIDEASDPSLTPTAPDYVYQGGAVASTDPGLGNTILDIKIIPTGTVFVAVLNRLQNNLATDNWSFNGRNLTALDFFANPLSNYPADLTTTVHPGNAIDDIHPSNITIYLNSLVHYAVIYQENPINLPTENGVPANIASIFKEIVWNVVLNDTRTGVASALSVKEFSSGITQLNIYPNPSSTYIHFNTKEDTPFKIINLIGKTVLKGTNNKVNITNLPKGLYLLNTNGQAKKFIKQ